MKFLKSFFLSVVIAGGIAFVSQAQETPSKKDNTAAQAQPQSKADANRDFDSRMAKLQQAVNKMSAKVDKVKDPQMKTDMTELIAKMKQITDEYNSMKNTAGLSEQQQEQSKKKIRAEMDEARKMHDDMKEKYGDQMGGKAKKGNQQQQPPQQAQPEGTTPK